MKKKTSPSREEQDKEKLTPFYAPRGEPFKNLIKNMLLRGKIKEHYVSQLLTKDALSVYSRAFTSNSVTSRLDPTNFRIEEDKESAESYEMLEKLGDGVFDNFIGWYAFRRFGEIETVSQVKLVHIIRSKYGSKNEFSPIAEKLGFWPFITASVYQRNHQKKKLLEDTFEAFLGATSLILDKRFRSGVGYAICYDILSSVFEDIVFSEDFSEMQDFVSKLNQLFMKYKDLGKIKYTDEKNENMTKVNVYRTYKDRDIFIGMGTAPIKKDAKQNAAKYALNYLSVRGYE